MDRNAAEEIRILNLVQEAESARTRIIRGIGALRTRLDPVARLRGSLTRHPSSWLFGSLAVGVAARFLLRRPPKAAARMVGGPLGAILGLALTAARPMLKVWLANRLREWLAARAQPGRRAPVQDPHTR
jgi:hypothetical protein